MGQLIVTVVGGAIGGLLGGPLGASIGMSLGGMVGATLFGPTIKGPRLSDLKVTASTYGNVIPKGYGTFRVGGNMIWSDGIEETKKKVGGKGGPKQEVYYYYSTFAMSICEGEIDDITRIWADGKIILDKTGGSHRSIKYTGELLTTTIQKIIDIQTAGLEKTGLGKVFGSSKYKFRLYRGDELQYPDSIMEAKLGVGNVSAHRGMAYIVFDRMPLEDFGNRVPQLTFEVVKTRKAFLPYIRTVDKITGNGIKGFSRFFCDHTNGRIFTGTSYGNDEPRLSVIDGASMAEVRRVQLNLFPSQARNCYIQGSGIFIREIDSSNSRRCVVQDLFSMSTIETIGVKSLSTSGFFIPSSKANAISGVGPVGYHYGYGANGREIRLVFIGYFRDVWARVLGNDIPLFNTKATFVPTGMLTGYQGPDAGQTIGWRVNNGYLEMEMWEILAFAEGKIKDGKWVQTDRWKRNLRVIRPFAGENFSLKYIGFDESDRTIFCLGTSNGVTCAFKYQWEEDDFRWIEKYPNMYVAPPAIHGGVLTGGTYGWLFYSYYTTNAQANQIDLYTGEVLRNDSFSKNTLENLNYAGDRQIWDGRTGSVILNLRNGLSRVMFRDGSVAGQLHETVKAICLDTKILTEDDIDLTDLTEDAFVGYVVDAQSTARDLLKQLGTAFFFEGYESDYKLKFRSRGSSPVANVPEDWAGRDDEGVAIKEAMTQELELPMRTSITYYDLARDHQQGTQTAKRTMAPIPSMWSTRETNIELPMSWTAQDAKRCAEKMLKMSWANRTNYSLSLPWRYLKYDPTDVITYTKEDGTVFTMRLAQATIGADFTVEINGVSEKAAAYTSNATAEAGVAPVQSVGDIFPATPIVLNTPLLRDVDYNTANNSVLYVTADSIGTFNGASVMIDDGPVDFTTVGYVRSEGVIGVTVEALPPTVAYESTDEDTVLTIQLTDADATLESTTQDEMLTSYVNAALIGEEIIQFRNAAPQADGSWQISGILRARRGTNYAVNSHKPGERFILLNETTLARYFRPPEQYVTNRTFKAVPPSTLSEDAIAYPQNLVPRDLMPLTPENVTITDDGTTVTITAQRRSRVLAPLTDGVGNIHYKEGDKLSARFVYQVWPNLTVTDLDTQSSPDISGFTPLFDSAGDDVEPVITFPLASLGGATKFLLKLYERGVVDGMPKWIEFTRMSQGDWNRVEAY